MLNVYTYSQWFIIVSFFKYDVWINSSSFYPHAKRGNKITPTVYAKIFIFLKRGTENIHSFKSLGR